MVINYKAFFSNRSDETTVIKFDIWSESFKQKSSKKKSF